MHKKLVFCGAMPYISRHDEYINRKVLSKFFSSSTFLGKSMTTFHYTLTEHLILKINYEQHTSRSQITDFLMTERKSIEGILL